VPLGFKSAGTIDVVGAEAHAERAQRGARPPGRDPSRLGDRSGALDDAERLGELEGDAAGRPWQTPRPCDSSNSGPSSVLDLGLEPEASRACTFSREAPVSCSSERMRSRGVQRVVAGNELGHRVAESSGSCRRRSSTNGARRGPHPASLRVHRSRRASTLGGGAAAPWRRCRPRPPLGCEAEAIEPADTLALDGSHHRS
jgi:hypothetical protein